MTDVTVSLVLVSHSGNLAKGLVEVAGEMAPDVVLLPAGGTEDDRIGTSYDRVRKMVDEARVSSPGVLLLSDLGSSAMLAEMLVEEFDDDVQHVEVPFVEGAVAAAVAAQGGADLAGVVDAAQEAVRQFSAPTGTPAAESSSDELVEHLVLKNTLGLHARPAAMVARIVGEYDAQVTLNGVDGASVLALMGLALPGGAEVELCASGAQASAVLKALVPHFEEGFGEE